MNIFGYISWDVAPELISSPITLRYYSLFFAISFIIGFALMKKMMKRENAPESWVDKIFFYVFIGTILGARLGQVFFYEPEYYLSNPIEIFKIWEGGLASHGAAIAVIISLWIYAKYVTKRSFYYGADKAVVTIAIAASLIRLGNLANSEIIGERSESNSAFFFEYEAKKNAAAIFNNIDIYDNFQLVDITFEPIEQKLDSLSFSYPLATLKLVLVPQLPADEAMPRASEIATTLSHAAKGNFEGEDYHYFTLGKPVKTYTAGKYVVAEIPVGLIPRFPTQIWESLAYLLLFVLLMFGYWKKQWYRKEGLLFGVFLLGLFGARFIIEFWKEKQTYLEDDSPLTMGQWLSIPAFLVGLLIIIIALRKEPLSESSFQIIESTKK
jgi:phosphatidylglycerol---prolipoprotein diacylglyceryl transferase